jgi:tetratricopeptide (TPR) repeat protein
MRLKALAGILALTVVAEGAFILLRRYPINRFKAADVDGYVAFDTSTGQICRTFRTNAGLPKQKASPSLRYSIDLDPNYWFDYCFLGRAYEQRGRLPEAIEAFQRELALEGNTELWSGLGHAYALPGKRAEAQKVLDHLKELSAHSYVAPYNVAVPCKFRGADGKATAV